MTRPVLALCLLFLFHAVAFGLRSWQQRRATGEFGFRGLSGRPGSPAWFGGVLFGLGSAGGLAAVLAELAGWIAPLWQPPAWVAALAVVATLAGIVATYAAQRGMGSAWRIGVRAAERTPLVTDGPFAWVRNPIFSCMLWTAGGLTLLLPDLLTLGSLGLLVLAVELQVRVVEEPHLLGLHGGVYRDYARRVGRFVPGLGRLR